MNPSNAPPVPSRPTTPTDTSLEDIHRQNCMIINMLTILQRNMDEVKTKTDEFNDLAADNNQKDPQTPEKDKGKATDTEETPQPGPSTKVPKDKSEDEGEPTGYSIFDIPKPWDQTTPIAPTNSFTAPTNQSTIGNLKLKAPEPLKSTKPQEARKWLVRVGTWAHLSANLFPSERVLAQYILTLMEDKAGDWALPYLAELGDASNPLPTIRNMKTLASEFSKAFSDPDKAREAARKIVELKQEDVDTKSASEYATEFKTIAAELSWNDEALMAQFARGLHWKTAEVLSQRERQPQTLKGLIEAAVQIDNVRQENEAQRTKHHSKEKPKEKSKSSGGNKGKGIEEKDNYVSKEERNRRKEWGLCIKCGKGPHRAADCKSGWNSAAARKPEEKREPKKEAAKAAAVEESDKEVELGKE